jgi:hypothetical protein
MEPRADATYGATPQVRQCGLRTASGQSDLAVVIADDIHARVRQLPAQGLGQRTIEAITPMINNNAALAGSPNA